ncbi:MAG: TOBE domain-containing protein [Betaproteobacteria bacterium]|nr:TOBE domain-containing protein [Betaproteobacteria bacterium]
MLDSSRVERCLFLGSITRVTLGLDDLGGQRVTIELQGRRDDMAPGMALAVRLPPAALLRFDDSTR